MGDDAPTGDRLRMAVYRKMRWAFYGMAVFYAILSAGVATFLIAKGDATVVGVIAQGVVFAGAFGYAARAKHVVVGVEGVLSERVPFGERYVTYEEFDEVTLVNRIVELRRRGATVLKIDHAEDPSSLAARVQEGRERYLAREAAERPPELGRAGRPLGDWHRELRLQTEGGEYRGKPLSSQALVRLAEDPGADLEERVVAAAVAASAGGEGVRRRVRVLAEETANPELARAFERAAEGEVAEAPLRRARQVGRD